VTGLLGSNNVGNPAADAVAGLLHTVVSPSAAFGYVTGACAHSLAQAADVGYSRPGGELVRDAVQGRDPPAGEVVHQRPSGARDARVDRR
jgi:hypothetical protein